MKIIVIAAFLLPSIAVSAQKNIGMPPTLSKDVVVGTWTEIGIDPGFGFTHIDSLRKTGDIETIDIVFFKKGDCEMKSGKIIAKGTYEINTGKVILTETATKEKKEFTYTKEGLLQLYDPEMEMAIFFKKKS